VKKAGEGGGSPKSQNVQGGFQEKGGIQDVLNGQTKGFDTCTVKRGGMASIKVDNRWPGSRNRGRTQKRQEAGGANADSVAPPRRE